MRKEARDWAGIAIFLIAVFVFVFSVGCGKQEPSKEPKEYTVVGYVRSMWLHQHMSYVHTTIAFEADDGNLIEIKLASLDPRLWQGMRARLTYRESLPREGCNGYRSYCFKDDKQLFVLVAVERLDR